LARSESARRTFESGAALRTSYPGGSTKIATMVVLDTNLLVRLATNDAPRERGAVTDLLGENECRISKTVLLETEWVLRSRYGYTNQQFADFSDHLLAFSTVFVEDESVVRLAVDSARAGLDFADAMHLAVAIAADEVFYTFDRKLFRKASRIKGARVQLLDPKRQQ
jgi:predicted nucleic acid-binding protein